MVLAGYYSGMLTHKCEVSNAKEWGCNEPVSKPRWNLLCTKCLGNKGNKECKQCEGNGIVGMHRCPNHYTSNDIDFVFQFYIDLETWGKMPCDGGLLDQTAYYVKTIRMIRRFTSAWADYKDKKEQEKAEAIRRAKAR